MDDNKKNNSFEELPSQDNEGEFNAEDSIIVLQDEDGKDVEFEYIDSVELEGREFIVLLPTDEEDSDVAILEVKPVEGDPDMEEYLPVQEDDILDQVYAIFRERFKDEFDFVEDEEE